jgi:F-type H+-transporting ATPase subunit b
VSRQALRRVVLCAMVLTTGWSAWAWAQPAQNGAKAPAAAEGHGGDKGTARSEAAEESQSEEPAPMNWTEFGKETPPYIAMLINFGLLVGGYYLFGKKPIAEGLKNRRDAIAREIEEAQTIKEEAEARAKTYQAKLEKLDDEMRHAREALVRAGEAERDRLVAEAEAKAERMRKDAQFMVEQELKQLQQDVWRGAVETAVVAAEEMLRKRVTQADQERLAEDYLSSLSGLAGKAAS